MVDPPPPDAGLDAGAPDDLARREGVIDTWRETMPKRTTRSRDLPLSDAPEIALTAIRHGEAVDATVRVEEPVSLRWQARGRIEGEAQTVRWFPADEEDRLVVAVRSKQGLALASVRARQVA